MAERGLRGGGLLLERDRQPRTGGDFHRLLGDERQRMCLARGTAHGPAARAVLGGRGVVDDVLGVEARLREVGDGRGELHLARTVHREGQVLRGRVVARLVPDDVALRVERDHTEAFQPLARLGAIPHHDALQRAGLLQVHFPPRVFLRLGVGDGAFVVFAIGLAINGAGGSRTHVNAALLRLAFERDVLAATEDLHFGKLEELAFRRQLDAHEARDQPLALSGRQDARAHAGDDEVSASMSGAFAGQLVIRQRFESERSQFLRVGHGQFDGEVVLGRLVLRDEDRAVVLRRECCAGGRLRGAGLRRIPVQLHRKRLRPFLCARQDCGGRRLELCFHRREFRFPVGALLALRVAEEAEERRLVALIGILGVVEECVELVILLLRNGVVFVRVALGTGHRGAHPDGEGRVDAVHDGGGAPLLVVRAAFVVSHRVAMEGGALELFVRRAVEQVGGELLQGEPVERQVVVEGVDDVVTVSPDDARRIVRVTGAVRVAREVQPQPRPVLAVARLRQLRVHEALVSLRLLVGDERVHLGDARRQAGEVQRDATGERVAVGLRLGEEAVLGEATQDEGVCRGRVISDE